MSSLNKVQLIGRVGKDPESRTLQNGTKVANFNIATSEKCIHDGEKKEITEWHRIVFWRKLAEIVEKYVSKGQLIYIEGKLVNRSWEKDGQKHYMTEIVGQNMEMLTYGEKKQENGLEPVNDSNDDKDDLPF